MVGSCGGQATSGAVVTVFLRRGQGVTPAHGDGLSTGPHEMGRDVAKETDMTTKLTKRLIREGDFVAEVDVLLVEEEGGWSPYLSLRGRRQARCGQGRAACWRHHARCPARNPPLPAHAARSVSAPDQPSSPNSIRSGLVASRTKVPGRSDGIENRAACCRHELGCWFRSRPDTRCSWRVNGRREHNATGGRWFYCRFIG